MDPSSPLRALHRDSFVANVLWVGICLLCQGAICSELDFRGGTQRGEVDCENGLGDLLRVRWDDQGVVALVHHHHEPTARLTPSAPDLIAGLAESALTGFVRPTGWLWICGDSSSPRIPSTRNSLLSLIDAFCGPALVSSEEALSLERGLFEAIVCGPAELTGDPLKSPLMSRAVNRLGTTKVEAAHVLAEDLLRPGLAESSAPSGSVAGLRGLRTRHMCHPTPEGQQSAEENTDPVDV